MIEVKAAAPLVSEPDIKWLGFVQKVSQTVYSRGQATYQFDPGSDFILRYQSRREEMAKNGSFRVKG